MSERGSPSPDAIFLEHTKRDPTAPARNEAGELLRRAEAEALARREEALRPWRRVRELGRGAMGVVYEVVHEETGERRALKLMLASRDALDPDDLERFRREAELASRLAHPNLVRVHAWRLEPWPPYLVLDLLPGGSLKDRLERFPLPPEEARQIAVALADGLAHAHAHGVLHRDLKPANVMFDEEGRPRLADFGLARGLHAGEHGLTRTGEMLGTPLYMSPEQALDSKRLDERSDIYGLGGILYAMLTGQSPIQDASNLVEAVEAVVNRAPLAPSRLRQGIPSGLEDVCLQALAKDPADRFPSAGAFRDALLALAPRTAPVSGRAGRGRGVWLAALALPLVLVVGLALLLLGRREPATAPPLATAAPAPPPDPDAMPPGVEVAAGAWTPGTRLHLVHTHGWRPPDGQEQTWLSLVVELEALDGPELRITLLRARYARVEGAGPARIWDTEPFARSNASPPLELLELVRKSLRAPLRAGARCEGNQAWGAAIAGLTGSGPAWARRYEPAGLVATWSAWARLELSTPDERPRPGVATRELDGRPLWATWTDEQGGWEALARAEVDTPGANLRAPLDHLAGTANEPDRAVRRPRMVTRGYLSSLNACRLFDWSTTGGELLLRPIPGLLPGVPSFTAAPARSASRPTQVRARGAALAHAWPWGPALCQLPSEGRYLRLGDHGEWARIAWGGGVAYVPARDLEQAQGALGRVATKSDPALVYIDQREASDIEIGRLEHDTVFTLEEALDTPLARARFWFDERIGQLPGWYGSKEERYMLWERHGQ